MIVHSSGHDNQASLTRLLHTCNVCVCGNVWIPCVHGWCLLKFYPIFQFMNRGRPEKKKKQKPNRWRQREYGIKQKRRQNRKDKYIYTMQHDTLLAALWIHVNPIHELYHTYMGYTHTSFIKWRMCSMKGHLSARRIYTLHICDQEWGAKNEKCTETEIYRTTQKRKKKKGKNDEEKAEPIP